MANKKPRSSKRLKQLTFMRWLKQLKAARIALLLVAAASFGSVGYAAVQHSQAQSSGWGRVIIQNQKGSVASGTVNVSLVELGANFGDIKATSFNLPYYDLLPQTGQDYTYRLQFVSASDLGSNPMEFSHWRLFSSSRAERIVSNPTLTVKRSELNSTNIFMIVKPPEPEAPPAPKPPKTPPKKTPATPTPRPKPATPPSVIPRPTPKSPAIEVESGTPSESAADTAAPKPPEQFSAVLDGGTNHVLLSWQSAVDDTGISHYVLERSQDEKTWEVMNESVPYLTYVDSGVGFSTKYFYRIKAVDYNDKASSYVKADITTAPFDANVTVAEGGTFTTEGNWMTVTVPAQAVSEDAKCSVVDADELVPVEKGHEVFAGPYRIVCKTAQGSSLTSFLRPAEVTVSVGAEVIDQYRNISFQAQKDGNWSVLDAEFLSDTASFTLQDNLLVAGTGELKSTPLWMKLLLTLAGVGTAGLAVLYVVYRMYRQREISRYRAYYKKQYGL